MSKLFAIIATLLFAAACLICAAAALAATGTVNVTVVPEIVNVTVEQEAAPTVTVTTTVGEVMNIVTSGEQGIQGVNGTNGADGSNGREIELHISATYLQWRYVGDIVWLDLLPLSEITGPPGTDGVRGYDGREIELQISATHVQWRYLNAATWTNLIALSAITGTNGTDGNSYTCYITAGVQTLTYDKNGSNPAPTMVAFAAEMRENGSVVTPSCSWSAPATGSLLSGSSATCSFTPTVAGSFSAGSADNRVNLVATYNGITCLATAPVAVTKVGADGLPADPETKAQLYTKIGTAVTGDVLNTSSGPGDADGFAFRTVRINGNVHRTDLVPGKTVIYSQSTDTADTIKLEVRKPSGATAFTVSAGGALVIY